jgi:acyl carrier protein
MSPTEAEVLQAIQQIAAKELNMAREILPSHALFGDLELDSITLVTLLASLENRFRVCLPSMDSMSLRTIEDLIRMVIQVSQGSLS